MKIRKIFSTITVLAMLGSAICGISAMADNAQNQITPTNASGQLTITLEIKEPATASYAQVGTDYEPTSADDKPASLWKVTVTPGTDAVETLSVDINGSRPKNPLSGNPVFSGKGSIVFGVVVNAASAYVQSFTALVNGEAVTTTVE